VIALFSNPELIRNIRAQLRPKKMLSVAAICAVLSISIGYFFAESSAYNNAHDWATNLLVFAIGAQAAILVIVGSIACLNAIFKEKEHNSFDFQRVTRLIPLELAVGKLFGAPILAYFICLCLMPLSIFAAVRAQCGLSFYLAAYVVLLVGSLAFHLLSLLISVLSIRGSQTGAVILMLMVFWFTSISGSFAQNTLFRLGSMSPFFAASLVSQSSWDPRDLEKTIRYPGGGSYETNGGMTDVFFGKHVHHVPVFLAISAALGLWFLLAVVRNIKRDPAEYEVYSPAQSLAFAFFLNFIFLSFFNWHFANGVDGAALLLSMDMGVLIVLGLTLLRNRERTRRIVRARERGPSWLDELWPSPLLFLAALGTGALIAAGAVLAHAAGQDSGPVFLAARIVFLALWLVRDQQYLQWMSLRQGRNPLVMGVLYLVIFYICSSILLAAFDSSTDERIAFTAFFLPTPVHTLTAEAWAQRPAIWLAAYLTQAAMIVSFISLQRKELAKLQARPEPPALEKQFAS